MFFKIGVLKNFANFIGNCAGVSSIKLQVFSHYEPGPATPGAPGSIPLPPFPPLYWVAKKKKKETEIKRNSFKAETIKRLLSRPKCYYFSHSIERLEFKIFFLSATMVCRFSVLHGTSTWKYISLVLRIHVLQNTCGGYFCMKSEIIYKTNYIMNQPMMALNLSTSLIVPPASVKIIIFVSILE